MNTAHTDLPKQSTLVPLFFSVLVHGAVLGALLLYQPAPKPPTPTGIETSLIGQDELLAIEGAIRENAKNAQAQAQDSQSEPVKQPSSAMQAYNQQLAEREARFQKQLAKFNAKQIAAAEAELEAFKKELKAEQAKAEAELAEARKAYANQHEVEEENKKQLDAARAEREKTNQEQENKGSQKSTADSTSTGKDGTATSGTAAAATKTTQGASKASIQAAVANHIKAHWNPVGETGVRLTANIRVDADGNVLSVSVSGGTEAQRESLERAIHASSPITPIIGTEYRSFSPYFVVQ